MRLFLSIILGAFLICLSACGSGSMNKKTKYSGLIEATGITTYQYGSHTLKTNDSIYALRSESLDLTQFEGDTVKIIAEKIQGYPVDGGPVYLKVLKLER